MTAEQISERFDISLAAARIRLEEIQKNRRLKAGEKRPLPNSVIEYLKEADKKGYRTTIRAR